MSSDENGGSFTEGDLKSAKASLMAVLEALDATIAGRVTDTADFGTHFRCGPDGV